MDSVHSDGAYASPIVQGLVDAAAEPTLILDPDGEVLVASTGARRLLGTEVIGHQIAELFPGTRGLMGEQHKRRYASAITIEAKPRPGMRATAPIRLRFGKLVGNRPIGCCVTVSLSGQAESPKTLV